MESKEIKPSLLWVNSTRYEQEFLLLIFFILLKRKTMDYWTPSFIIYSALVIYSIGHIMGSMSEYGQKITLYQVVLIILFVPFIVVLRIIAPFVDKLWEWFCSFTQIEFFWNFYVTKKTRRLLDRDREYCIERLQDWFSYKVNIKKATGVELWFSKKVLDSVENYTGHKFERYKNGSK